MEATVGDWFKGKPSFATGGKHLIIKTRDVRLKKKNDQAAQLLIAFKGRKISLTIIKGYLMKIHL
ncbi:MAG: hypothetical protein HXY53_04805 [Nitrospirae bacterium]|nr:hypothetical protein [Nitrospirota bacterium]